MMPGNGLTANVNFNMQGRKDYYLSQLVAWNRKSRNTKTFFIAGVQNAAETHSFSPHLTVWIHRIPAPAEVR